MFQILKRGFKKICEPSKFCIYFFLYLNITVSWTLRPRFFKISFWNLKHTFSNATRRALSNHDEKRKINFIKIFNCGHSTYTVNTVKIEYLHLDKPTAANILTLLVWQWELSFDAKISSLARLQYKHLHCKIFQRSLIRLDVDVVNGMETGAL